jgi:hypothetical protein
LLRATLCNKLLAGGAISRRMLAVGQRLTVLSAVVLVVITLVGTGMLPSVVLPQRHSTREITAEERLHAEQALYPLVVQAAVDRYNSAVTWVILDHTRGPQAEDATYVAELAPEISPETLQDLLSVSQESLTLSAHFTFDQPFLSQLEHDQIFRSATSDTGWEAFRTTFPELSGYLTLSRVGFNPAMDEAVVWVTEACGRTCGAGNIYYMVKRFYGWRISKVIQVWIS